MRDLSEENVETKGKRETDSKKRTSCRKIRDKTERNRGNEEKGRRTRKVPTKFCERRLEIEASADQSKVGRAGGRDLHTG